MPSIYKRIDVEVSDYEVEIDIDLADIISDLDPEEIVSGGCGEFGREAMVEAVVEEIGAQHVCNMLVGLGHVDEMKIALFGQDAATLAALLKDTPTDDLLKVVFSRAGGVSICTSQLLKEVGIVRILRDLADFIDLS